MGRSCIVRYSGLYRRENVGMSSERQVRILSAENLRIPEEGSSAQGKSGPKPRAKAVGDGQQVEIPVPWYNRTVGTREDKGSREWKNRSKQEGETRRKTPLLFLNCDGERTKE